MRRHLVLLSLVTALACASAQAAGSRWSFDDIVQAYGQPISAVRTAGGGLLMSYDNLPTRRFVSDSTYRRYPQNLWKHSTASLQFALNPSMQCTNVALVFNDAALDSKVLAGDPNGPSDVAALRADVNTALTASLTPKCS